MSDDHHSWAPFGPGGDEPDPPAQEPVEPPAPVREPGTEPAPPVREPEPEAPPAEAPPAEVPPLFAPPAAPPMAGFPGVPQFEAPVAPAPEAPVTPAPEGPARAPDAAPLGWPDPAQSRSGNSPPRASPDPPAAGNWPPPLPPAPGAPGSYPAPSGTVPGNATASLILGVVGIFLCPLICSIAAISLGVSARKEIDANPQLGGRSMAGWGIGLGIAGVAFWLIGIVIIAAGASIGGINR